MSKGQQCGSLAIVCVIFGAVAMPRMVAYMRAQRQTADFAKMAEIKSKYSVLPESGTIKKRAANQLDTIFHFDPNTVTFDELVLLGLPEKTATAIVNYRKAGGKFRKPDDFARIRDIDDSVYNRLSPYINIVRAEQPKKTYSKDTKTTKKAKTSNQGWQDRKEAAIVELNTADSTQLVAMYGIGPTTARRIISYRRLLGGFYSVEQLREVQNFNEETYIKLYPQFAVDTSKIKRINLNDFKYNDLKRHPYVTTAQLNSIMNYKKLMGRFNAVGDLLKYHLLDTLTYERVQPYLEVR
ncbi:MAG: helix-hairpin-helix domain-containing protein [Salinivirgaceae bacterium]|nr:helix-hairpin-helix domain-containing protein [Salinivirgaceae bacterium]